MNFATRPGKQGNTLMITLFFCLAIGMVLASVLKLISVRYTNSIRSTSWNEAIPVCEAGIEEAMTHLHDDTLPSANGWTATSIGGNVVYTKQRTFTDRSYCSVTIYNATSISNAPIIWSQGYIPSPLSASQYIARTVRVTTAYPPTVFTKAIATTGLIKMSGGGSVRGFDSRLGPYSSTNQNSTGNVASDSTNRPAIDVGTGNVYGNATTGPGGTVSVAGGSVGDMAWSSNHTGIEPGFTNNNMNVAFPSNSPPSGPFLFPTVTVLGSSNITYLPTGSYQMSSFTSSDSTKPMIVTGNATLYVTGSLTVSGSGYIQVAPGASLKLIVGGTATVSGGGVVNSTGLAANFSMVGLTGCGTITYSGSAAFIGTVNAPQADLTISGSAAATGAVITKTATLSGGASFIYDNALGQSSYLVATGWTER
jgi:hypothetical protein